MIQTIRIYFLRRAHTKALAEAHAYARQKHWSLLVQTALWSAEHRAANRLALAINPRALTRAY